MHSSFACIFLVFFQIVNGADVVMTNQMIYSSNILVATISPSGPSSSNTFKYPTIFVSQDSCTSNDLVVSFNFVF